MFQIAEMYSFLPREAVTRFLMSCTDCQKRMHLSGETNNNSNHTAEHNGLNHDTKHNVPATNSSVVSVPTDPSVVSTVAGTVGDADSGNNIDYSLPFTTTYNRMKASQDSKTASYMTYEAGDIVEENGEVS